MTPSLDERLEAIEQHVRLAAAATRVIVDHAGRYAMENAVGGLTPSEVAEPSLVGLVEALEHLYWLRSNLPESVLVQPAPTDDQKQEAEAVRTVVRRTRGGAR